MDIAIVVYGPTEVVDCDWDVIGQRRIVQRFHKRGLSAVVITPTGGGFVLAQIMIAAVQSNDGQIFGPLMAIRGDADR